MSNEIGFAASTEFKEFTVLAMSLGLNNPAGGIFDPYDCERQQW